MSENKDEKLQIDPSMLDDIKRMVLKEIQDEQTRKMEESRLERERQRKEYDEYVTRMKESKEPWVDVTGWTENEKGVRVELEWNDAFVDYLRANGISGADDEQIVQKWVTLLLRDMADNIEEDLTDSSGSEFG